MLFLMGQYFIVTLLVIRIYNAYKEVELMFLYECACICDHM
jgi:hypothetical protein